MLRFKFQSATKQGFNAFEAGTKSIHQDFKGNFGKDGWV